MKRYNKKTIKKVRMLRKEGNTYQEIRESIGSEIPKSTLATWCKDVLLPENYDKKIKKIIDKNLNIARKKSLEIRKQKRKIYFDKLYEKNISVGDKIINRGVAKIALAVLYLGEGGKTKKGSITFGNSDPKVIRLFLKLIRYCYSIDESKFRCTLQCRADQEVVNLEKFWGRETKIPIRQFYKARIDPRTIGKPSRKKDYKGVCRIEYFCADIFWEIGVINDILIEKNL